MGTFDPYYGGEPPVSAAQAAQSAHAAYLLPALQSGGEMTAASSAAPAAADMPARLRVSTRNLLRGRVSGITPGAVNSIVLIDIGGGNRLTAVVTLDSLRDLGLSVGSQVVAAINANDILLLG